MGQAQDVLVLRLEAVNGGCDDKVIQTQNIKERVNEELMEGIRRRHDEEPVLLPLFANDFTAAIFERLSGAKNWGDQVA